MKKLITSTLIALLLVVNMPISVLAATSVYTTVSSGSINVGSNVTVSVVVNSGSDEFSTAEARISYNSSVLQFVSYSSVSMSEAASSNGASSFKYTGFKTPPLLSGVRTMYSVTFKGIAAGTSSISLSEVLVLNGETTLASSGSGSSVSVTSPSSGGGGGAPTGGGGGSSTNNSSPKPNTNSTPDTSDKVAPALNGEPTFDKSQSTINLKFGVNEAASVKLTYYREGVDKKTIDITEAKTEHEILVGKDDPLTPGYSYKIEIVLTDAAGNASPAAAWDVRTNGVQYKIKLLDKSGNPIANQALQLFSDPISTSTDAEGVAVFDDVPVGEHTLVTEIDGVTLRKPVMVGADVSSESDTGFETISMPVIISSAVQSSDSDTNWLLWLVASFFMGAIVTKLPVKTIINKLSTKLKPKKA